MLQERSQNTYPLRLSEHAHVSPQRHRSAGARCSPSSRPSSCLPVCVYVFLFYLISVHLCVEVLLGDIVLFVVVLACICVSTEAADVGLPSIHFVCFFVGLFVCWTLFLTLTLTSPEPSP